MADSGWRDQYEAVRDYVLLAICVILLLTGAAVIVTGNIQGGVALLGAGMTAGGLVPTLQRDKGE